MPDDTDSTWPEELAELQRVGPSTTSLVWSAIVVFGLLGVLVGMLGGCAAKQPPLPESAPMTDLGAEVGALKEGTRTHVETIRQLNKALR